MLPPKMGSIFNQAVWDHITELWKGADVWCIVAVDAANHWRYMLSCMSLESVGCTGEPLLIIGHIFAFVCILHCCMVIGHLLMAFLEN